MMISQLEQTYTCVSYTKNNTLLPSNIHIQWFAAEDEGRTEEPSDYKLRKAREEGRVVKSQELSGALGLITPTLMLLAVGPYMARTFRQMLEYYFSFVGMGGASLQGKVLAFSFFMYFIKLVWPIALVAVVTALAVNFAQVGFMFTLKPITPDFSKIIPRFGQFFQRTLFSVEAAFNLFKIIFKMGVIGAFAYFTISTELDKIINLMINPLFQSITYLFQLTMKLIIEAALVFLAFSIVDYIFQRRQFRESLKMTKQEVKEEYKMQEGDPLIQSRIKQRMRELLTKNMIANVPKADVVIANPTHFAIALEWEREKMQAPMVTAKGLDEMALRIRRIAEENSVPVVENKPLARAMYAEVEIGEAIPEKYWDVIAKILAHIYAANGEAQV